MNASQFLLGGLGIGAGLTYIFDRRLGRRRRSILRDKAVSAAKRVQRGVAVTSCDLSHRATGLLAEAKSVFTSKPASDRVLVERVRSKLGRYVSHPHAIEVTAHDGIVTLRGPILAEEVKPLLAAAFAARGVCDIDNQLGPVQERGGVSDLQGGRKRQGEPIDLMRENWRPATRLMVGLTGLSLIQCCAGRRKPLALLGIVAGAGMLARAVTNLELKRLLGVGAGRRAVDLQKTIHINAPVERVFQYWSDFENFPHFMRNVQRVRDLGGGRSRWTVAGPAGTLFQWDALVTRLEPDRVIAWRSMPGSVVGHGGIIHFEPEGDSRTRVHVQMSYCPPAGALGHAAAALLGRDPKTEMDEDLLRMKTFVETGKIPRDAAQPETYERIPAGSRQRAESSGQ